MPRICTGVFRHPCPVSPIHKTFITEDPPEPMVTMLVVEGGLIYLHKAAHGGFAAYEDGFTLLELCRKYYREAGLDAPARYAGSLKIL